MGPTLKHAHLLFDVYNKKCQHKSSLLSVLCAYWNEYTVLLAFTEKLHAVPAVWRNFSILSPKLVLVYAENILSDSTLKNCAKCKSG